MELNHLRYFFEVARAGSFTKAARHLRLSQSALSKTVGLLEERAAVKLLQRSKSGATLTPIGAKVYAECQKIFASVANIEKACSEKVEVCAGPLRLGTSDHIANYLMAPLLCRLQDAHPLLAPSIFSGTPNEIVERILKNEIEFGLFFTKVPLAGLHYSSIRQIPMRLVCHPKLLANVGADLSWENFKKKVNELTLITSIQRDYQKNPSHQLAELFEREPKRRLESSSQETQKRLCISGGGLAFLAEFMVEREIQAQKLVAIPLPKSILAEMFLVRKNGIDLSFNARSLLDSV